MYTTLAAVSAQYGITRHTLWHRLRAREIPFKRQGRDLMIPLTRVEELIHTRQRKSVRKHELYPRWQRISKRRDTERQWACSFDAFVEGVGEKPEGAQALIRRDTRLGFVPGNTVWL